MGTELVTRTTKSVLVIRIRKLEKGTRTMNRVVLGDGELDYREVMEGNEGPLREWEQGEMEREKTKREKRGDGRGGKRQ